MVNEQDRHDPLSQSVSYGAFPAIYLLRRGTRSDGNEAPRSVAGTPDGAAIGVADYTARRRVPVALERGDSSGGLGDLLSRLWHYPRAKVKRPRGDRIRPRRHDHAFRMVTRILANRLHVLCQWT